MATTPCPQILVQYGDHNDMCPNTAEVTNLGPDADGHNAYKCECGSGHVQYFDQAYYDENVTE